MSKYTGKTDSEILYIFALDVLEILSPEGVWSTTERAPLTVKQIETELLKVREHTRYDRQTLRVEAEDGTYVVLNKGIIRHEKGATV